MNTVDEVSGSSALRSVSALLALCVHAVFIALLVISVNWQDESPAPVAAELWTPSELNTQSQQQNPPQIKHAEIVPSETSKPVIPSEPVMPSPDIALAEKKHKLAVAEHAAEAAAMQAAKQQAEQAQKLVEQQATQQQAVLIAKKRSEALKKLLVQQTQAGFSTESEHALNGVRAQLASGKQAGQDAGVIAMYKDRITAKIRGRIILPVDLQGNPQALFAVRVLPTGEVVQVQLLHSSGQPAYDDAVQRAIIKASPLPMPTNAMLASQFENLNLKFSPNDP